VLALFVSYGNGGTTANLVWLENRTVSSVIIILIVNRKLSDGHRRTVIPGQGLGTCYWSQTWKVNKISQGDVLIY